MANWTVHTTTGGNCDDCGKHRRTLYVAGVNQHDGAVEVSICFFCTKKAERLHEKTLREMAEQSAATPEEIRELQEADEEDERSYEEFWRDELGGSPDGFVL